MEAGGGKDQLVVHYHSQSITKPSKIHSLDIKIIGLLRAPKNPFEISVFIDETKAMRGIFSLDLLL